MYGLTRIAQLQQQPVQVRCPDGIGGFQFHTTYLLPVNIKVAKETGRVHCPACNRDGQFWSIGLATDRSILV